MSDWKLAAFWFFLAVIVSFGYICLEIVRTWIKDNPWKRYTK